MRERGGPTHEAASCTGKIGYAAWADGEAAILRIVAENVTAGHETLGRGLATYRCEYCGLWHTGHGRAPEYVRARRPPRVRR